MPTLFVQAAASIHLFQITHQVDVSEAFINCADAQLTPLFERLTGIKASKNVCFAITNGAGGLHYKKGKESQMTLQIFVNLHWNPIIVKWTSKSGRIYEFGDQDIDCNDIEFSFGELDAVLYHQQLYPDVALPFQLSDLSYELRIDRLNMDAEITLLLKEPVDTDLLVRDIANMMEAYNEASEKKKRKNGVVHNFKSRVVDDRTVVIDFDLGSAGVFFLKKLLEFLSARGGFDRVVVG